MSGSVPVVAVLVVRAVEAECASEAFSGSAGSDIARRKVREWPKVERGDSWELVDTLEKGRRWGDSVVDAWENGRGRRGDSFSLVETCETGLRCGEGEKPVYCTLPLLMMW